MTVSAQPLSRPPATDSDSSYRGTAIVVYDGVCALCNRSVRFALRHDRHDAMRFAPLQSEFARAVVSAHGGNADDLDTVYVVADYGTPAERLLSKSDAILYLLGLIGGGWRMAGVARCIPRRLRDWMYDRIASNRYAWVRPHETCPLPRPEERAKFIA